MKHRMWYMIYGSASISACIINFITGKLLKLKNVRTPPNTKDKANEAIKNLEAVSHSERLYSLCPNLRYKPRGLPAFWESSFVLTFTILVLFVKMPIIGVNKYKYARKDHRANAEFSPSTYGLIIYEIKTTSDREKIILSLLVFQNFFLVAVALCILYRPLGGFLTPSVLCVVDAILYPPITSILSTTPFTSEFNTKKKKVQ